MHLVQTLSIALLLSAPLALHALPGDPYDQRTQINAQIVSIQGTIANLQKQYDAIEPQKAALALAASDAKGEDKKLLVQTGQRIRELGSLASQTALLIKERETEIKLQETKLAALALRIATLEPSTKVLPALTIETFRQNVLPGIQGWKKSKFTYCKTTKVLSEDKAPSQKAKTAIGQTVAKSDQSAPYFIKEEQARTLRASAASAAAYALSLGYTYPTIKMITVPAGKGLSDTLSVIKISPATSAASSSTTTPTATTDTDNK